MEATYLSLVAHKQPQDGHGLPFSHLAQSERAPESNMLAWVSQRLEK
jgi:hypothetical protein